MVEYHECWKKQVLHKEIEKKKIKKNILISEIYRKQLLHKVRCWIQLLSSLEHKKYSTLTVF